jgi:hypothetical protein
MAYYVLMTLWLKYDNKFLQDGLGAQALRQSVISGVAQYFGCKFIYTQIFSPQQHFSSNFNTIEEIKEQSRTVSDYFNFNYESSLPRKFDKRLKIKDLMPFEFLELLARYKFSRSDVLLEIGFPFYLLHRFPNCLKHLPGIYQRSRQRKVSVSDNNLVVHLRIGYGNLVTNNGTPRHLPIQYFVDVLRTVFIRRNLSRDSKVIIHTDAPEKSTTFRIISEHTLNELTSQGVTNGTADVILQPPDLSSIKSLFSEFNLEIKYGADWIETFEDMAEAQILLMARSAYSYLSGIYNPNTVIWPNNHGHSKLRNWISSNEIGVDATKFQLIKG